MPMDRSKLRAVISKHIKWLRWIFQLNQWTVNSSIGHIDGSIIAKCEIKSKYRLIDLTFDAEKTGSVSDAFDSLRHEMIHGMLAEYDLLYEAIERVAPKSEMEILDVLYHNACERSVGNIERMIDHGLGLDGIKLIARAKQVCKENES